MNRYIQEIVSNEKLLENKIYALPFISFESSLFYCKTISFCDSLKYFRTGPVMAVLIIWLYSLAASVFIVATTEQYTYNPNNKVFH